VEARQGKLVVLVLTAILASGAPPVSAQATAHLAAVIRGDYARFLATLAGPSAASYRGGDGRALELTAEDGGWRVARLP
jgi:hypothetical protein